MVGGRGGPYSAGALGLPASEKLRGACLLTRGTASAIFRLQLKLPHPTPTTAPRLRASRNGLFRRAAFTPCQAY